MAHGHPAARRYPLAYLWNEARFVQQRVNGMLASEAGVMHSVITHVLTGKGELNKRLKELTNGD